MPHQCRVVLKEYLDSEGRSSGPLFASQAGKQIGTTTLHRLFVRIAHNARLDHRRITPHAMRRYYGTQLLRGRASIAAVQRLLGHKHLSSTQCYLGVSEDDLWDAVAQLPDVTSSSLTAPEDAACPDVADGPVDPFAPEPPDAPEGGRAMSRPDHLQPHSAGTPARRNAGLADDREEARAPGDGQSAAPGQEASRDPQPAAAQSPPTQDRTDRPGQMTTEGPDGAWQRFAKIYVSGAIRACQRGEDE